MLHVDSFDDVMCLLPIEKLFHECFLSFNLLFCKLFGEIPLFDRIQNERNYNTHSATLFDATEIFLVKTCWRFICEGIKKHFIVFGCFFDLLHLFVKFSIATLQRTKRLAIS